MFALILVLCSCIENKSWILVVIYMYLIILEGESGSSQFFIEYRLIEPGIQPILQDGLWSFSDHKKHSKCLIPG